MLTRYFVYFQVTGKEPSFKLMAAKDLDTAEVIAMDIAVRDEVSLIGVTVAPDRFQHGEAEP
jgi:hypothetical protein